MNSVFAKWLGRKNTPRRVEIADLQSLATLTDADRADLANFAMSADWIDVRPGVIDEELPDDRQLYLKQGSIQIQTDTGYLLHLKADSPLARYPLPASSVLISLFAAEPCALLAVPRPPGQSDRTSSGQALTRPTLTTDEAEGFSQLAEYLDTQHCELPSLPDLALRIGEAIDDPRNGNADIARLIQL
ncbi:MAG: HDOD domain-containing protein, partial [Firmicutes bacterium]|nr:HDOD domain-containing protein [Bacillota bacterium]